VFGIDGEWRFPAKRSSRSWLERLGRSDGVPDNRKNKLRARGGVIQIVVDSSHMEKVHISPRQKTGWGYDELGTNNHFIGVPVQKNNWAI
jgi:hypothetical protein